MNEWLRGCWCCGVGGGEFGGAWCLLLAKGAAGTPPPVDDVAWGWVGWCDIGRQTILFDAHHLRLTMGMGCILLGRRCRGLYGSWKSSPLPPESSDRGRD